jgi:hypothetical protein
MPNKLQGLDQRDPVQRKITEWADELYREQHPYIRVQKGGTGQVEYTGGDMLYASEKYTLSKLAKGTAGQALKMNSGATAPEWGTLGAAGGGTGQSSYTTGDLLYASSSSALSKLGIGSTGQYLGVSGGLPAWVSLTVTPPGWELIADYTVSGGAVSSITFSSLDGDTDEWYRLEVWAIATGALGGLDVRPNNDTTASNYRYQFSQADNTTVSAGRADYTNGLILGNANTSGDYLQAQVFLRAKSGTIRMSQSRATSNINATTQMAVIWDCKWKDTAANITSLVLDATGAGSVIANNTRARLFKTVTL